MPDSLYSSRTHLEDKHPPDYTANVNKRTPLWPRFNQNV